MWWSISFSRQKATTFEFKGDFKLDPEGVRHCNGQELWDARRWSAFNGSRHNGLTPPVSSIGGIGSESASGEELPSSSWVLSPFNLTSPINSSDGIDSISALSVDMASSAWVSSLMDLTSPISESDDVDLISALQQVLPSSNWASLLRNITSSVSSSNGKKSTSTLGEDLPPSPWISSKLWKIDLSVLLGPRSSIQT